MRGIYSREFLPSCLLAELRNDRRRLEERRLETDVSIWIQREALIPHVNVAGPDDVRPFSELSALGSRRAARRDDLHNWRDVAPIKAP